MTASSSRSNSSVETVKMRYNLFHLQWRSKTGTSLRRLQGCQIKDFPFTQSALNVQHLCRCCSVCGLEGCTALKATSCTFTAKRRENWVHMSRNTCMFNLLRIIWIYTRFSSLQNKNVYQDHDTTQRQFIQPWPLSSGGFSFLSLCCLISRTRV